MEDEQFIREVNEEMRQDRMDGLWKKYKWVVFTVAILIVVLTAASRGWETYSTNQAAESGDKFMAAIALSNDGKHDEAIKNLEELGASGSGQYPALAKLRIASEMAENGKISEAVAAFEKIAADSSFNTTLQNVAKLRAGLLLVDSGSMEDVAKQLGSLAESGKPFRHSAREGLGLAAWKANQLPEAYKWFQQVADDAEAPSGVRSRADIMLKLLAGKGITKAG
ncbi:MAG: tetratricopeptide repeat protein [Rhizobiaceae bacterium]|nr:tetratricopeptide repeat protein [Rhizobiaceae bacterium]MBL4696009.1 tetratricopeptide repeat protein [Rhizobiaceae bacterium]